MRKVGVGHIIKCHLADEHLESMEPVISLAS